MAKTVCGRGLSGFGFATWRRARFGALVAAMALPVSTPLSARWYEASSPHFVVYTDGSEQAIRRFSEQLEHYHSALERVTQSTLTYTPSGRLTIYTLPDEQSMRSLYGQGGSHVAGFYIPRAGASSAFVPKLASLDRVTNFSQIVLLHEYTHYFLIGSATGRLPRWMNEGAAEFFSSAQFERNGAVSLGRPAAHRAQELINAPDVPVAALLDPDLYQKEYSRPQPNNFYAKSWLLYHYLTFEPSRNGQLLNYVREIDAGTGLADAGRKAFGDLAALERDVKHYARSPKMKAITVAATDTAPTITLRALSEGEAAMMPVRIRSARGINAKTAPPVYDEARRIAARYPGDAAVLAALAEAAYDANDDAAAISAADKAIAIDASTKSAYVQKGLALFRQARRAPDRARAFAAARQPFVALNRLENDHPLPLVFFYRSFADQGQRPPQLALDALARAAELAPFDQKLRMTLAMVQLRTGNIAAARDNLATVAYDPHDSDVARHARTIVQLIDSGQTTPAVIEAAFRGPNPPTQQDAPPPGTPKGK